MLDEQIGFAPSDVLAGVGLLIANAAQDAHPHAQGVRAKVAAELAARKRS